MIYDEEKSECPEDKIEVTFENDDGDEETHYLPAKMAVCHDCNGHGTVLNEGMRYHAYTQEEFSEFDDEEKEDYCRRGGRYDVTCPTCKGRNVEKVVDYDACEKDPQLKEILERYEEQMEDDAAYESMCRMERMMGA